MCSIGFFQQLEARTIPALVSECPDNEWVTDLTAPEKHPLTLPLA
jgi:hypothetical protein